MALKRGLGKGLDSMIPNKSNDIDETEKVDNKTTTGEVFLNINEIEPNRLQPRKHFDEDLLQDLADSIKQYGVLQPLIVQKKETYYEIIAGERRWRASKIAGIKELPVIIKDYSPREIVEVGLIENIQRQDLNPIEEANAYQRLIVEYGLKQDEIAENVSRSRTAITNSIRLLKLDKRVQEMLIDDMITSGHARAMLSIENGDKQYSIATKVFDNKLSVRETEKLVKSIIEGNVKEIKKSQNNSNNFIYKDIEEKIKNIIGTKVSINKKSNNTGKIEIEYYSDEELERLVELFETIR